MDFQLGKRFQVGSSPTTEISTIAEANHREVKNVKIKIQLIYANGVFFGSYSPRIRAAVFDQRDTAIAFCLGTHPETPSKPSCGILHKEGTARKGLFEVRLVEESSLLVKDIYVVVLVMQIIFVHRIFAC